jgi:hypothetical protein
MDINKALEMKRNLSEKQLLMLISEMQKHRKSTGVAYLLLAFFGTLGLHKFYMGKVGMGLLYIGLGVIGWLTIFMGLVVGVGSTDLSFAPSAQEAQTAVGVAGGFGVFGILCLVIVAVLLVIDLFTIPRQLRKQYERKEVEAIASLRI